MTCRAMFMDFLGFNRSRSEALQIGTLLIGATLPLVAVGGLAHADIGTVQTQNLVPSIQTESIDEGPAEGAATTIATEAIVAAVAEEEGVNRTWMLRTSAGPTAFVLDAKQFEFGIPVDRFSQMVWSYGAGGPWLNLNYGLTDSITVELGGSLYIATAGVKWNFWNPDPWSLSLNPFAGYEFGKQQYYYYGSKQKPYGLALAASRAIDPRHKMHFSLELARSSQTFSYNDSYSSYSWSEDGTSQATIARLAAAYELRFNPRHGMNFWLSPAITNSSGTRNYFSGGSGSTSNSSDTAASVELGVGYQYLREHFGVEVGLGFGPKWSRYRYSEYEGKYQSWEAGLSGGVSWRI